MNGAKRSERRIFMFEKLEAVEKRYEELTKMISDPEVISNQSEWQKLMKEHASIEDVVLKFREYKKVKQEMKEAEELLADPEMKELAEEELTEEENIQEETIYTNEQPKTSALQNFITSTNETFAIPGSVSLCGSGIVAAIVVLSPSSLLFE